MLKPMWNQAGVEEAAGDEAVPLAFGDERPVQPEIEDHRPPAPLLNPPEPAAISIRKATTLSPIST